MSQSRADRRRKVGTHSHRVRGIVAIAVLLVLAAALALAAGCGGEATSGTGDAAGGEQTVCVYDTTWMPYTSLDPSKEFWQNLYAYQVYETLTVIDASAEHLVKPLLATSWESSEGGKTWTFTLRKDVKFHNGETMTSADVKFSFDRSLKIGVGNSFHWDGIKSIEAPDPNTVVFNFSAPRAVPEMCATVASPGFIYSKAAFEKDGDKAFEAGTENAGSGPYMLTKAGTTETAMKRFDGYWGGWTGTHAKAPQIAVIRQVTEPSVRIQQVQQGDAQIVGGIPVANVESLKSDPNVQFVSGPWWLMDFLFINTKSGPTADLKLREALSYAFPYEQVLSLAIGDMGELGTGGVYPGQPSYDLQTETFGTPKQDMAKAEAALAQSKYADGAKLLCLVDEGYDQNMQIAQLFKAALQPLGINLDCRYQPTDVIYNNAMADNPPQSLYISEWGPPFPSQTPMLVQWFASWSGYNLDYWSTPETDKLLKKALELEAISPAEAGPTLMEVQKLAMAQHPLIVAVYPHYRAVMAKNITWSGFDPANVWLVPFYDVQMN